jgi:hypothetical protein
MVVPTTPQIFISVAFAAVRLSERFISNMMIIWSGMKSALTAFRLLLAKPAFISIVLFNRTQIAKSLLW